MNKKLLILDFFKKITLILVIFLGISAGSFAQNITIADTASSTATERNNARLIATGLDGKLHVVYYYYGINHSFSENNGESWSEPELIDYVASNPSIAFDSDNTLHLVYKCGGTNAYDIGHKTYNNGVWSETDTVYHSDEITFSRPHIAVDSDENLHCIWQRESGGEYTNSEIYYKKHTQGSGWDSEPTNISETFGASEYPTLVTDSENNVYAFWKDSGDDIHNDKMVLFRKYTVGTGWDENYTNVSNTTGNGSSATMDPCAIVDSEDNVHLVWKDSQTGNREIFYKKYTNGVWGDSLNISNTGTASGHPLISVDYEDSLYVVWEEKTDGVYYDIVYNSLVDGVWSDTVNISNTDNSDSFDPSISVKTGAYLHAIWTEGDSYPYSIMGNRVILNDNNQVPAINGGEFSINEFSANGTVIDTITASDPDDWQCLAFSITAGNTNDAFTIDSYKGIITVADSTALDYGTTPVFNLTVKVQDNGVGNLNDEATVTININNPTGFNNIESQNFKIYPNPARDFVNIEIQDNENKNTLVEIVNVNGQVIYSETINNNTKTINLSDYSSGIYHVRINTSVKRIIKKLIIY